VPHMTADLEEEKVPGDLARLAAGLPAQSRLASHAESTLSHQAPAEGDGFTRRPGAGSAGVAEDLPSSLSAANAARKRALPLMGAPVQGGPEPAVGKAASRSKGLTYAAKGAKVLAELSELPKKAKAGAHLLGSSAPALLDKAGDAIGGFRDPADNMLAGYAPAQEFFQGAEKVAGDIEEFTHLPQFSLGQVAGKDVKAGIPTNAALKAAAGAMDIRQYQRNEGTDPNATAVHERQGVEGAQQAFRRAQQVRSQLASLLDDAGGNLSRDEVADPVDQKVATYLGAQRNLASRSAFRKAGNLVRANNRLVKAQEGVGQRTLNEYSMEQSAYLNDKQFVPRKPLGFFDTPGASAPTMQDVEYGPFLPSGYRDDVAGGREMQANVTGVRALGGAGRFLEGEANADRMVRRGEYGKAYGVKAADVLVASGTGAGAAAAQAGLTAATGGAIAPALAALQVGKHAVGHVLKQAGKGIQSAAELAERSKDPHGLAKEQDHRDLWNSHYGLGKPEPAPVADGDPEPLPEGDASAEANADTGVQNPAGANPVHPLFAEAPVATPIAGGYDEVKAIRDRKYEYYGMPQSERELLRQGGNAGPQQAQAPVQAQSAPEEKSAREEKSGTEAHDVPGGDAVAVDPKPPVAAGGPYVDASARAADARARGVHFEKQGDRSILGRQDRTLGRAVKDWTWGSVKALGKGAWETLKAIPKGLAKVGSLVGKGVAYPFKALMKRHEREMAKLRAHPGDLARTKYQQLEEDAALDPLDQRVVHFDDPKLQEAVAALGDEEKVDWERAKARYDGVFGAVDPSAGQRVGGTRAQAKAALGAKPETARAEESAALREMLAPGEGEVATDRNEVLRMLRARFGTGAAPDEPRSAAGPGGPDPGGPGPGGPGAPGPHGPHRRDGDPDVPKRNPGPGERPGPAKRQHSSDEGSPGEITRLQNELDELDRRAAERARANQSMGMIQPRGQGGGQAGPAERRDEGPSESSGDARGGEGPLMYQLIDGHWQMAPEEEKGVRPVASADDAVRQGSPASMAGPSNVPMPGSVAQPETLDTSAAGVMRHQRLMDPRELALLANSADPTRTRRQLPAIQSAVAKAQGSDTKDDATAAWRDVDRLQRGVVNRRWSGYRPSDLASIQAAGARMESRRDLLGERMLDVSTRHEGLDLPEAQMPDRRLALGDDDQFRMPDFEMPGDEFDMFANPDHVRTLDHVMERQPDGHLPGRRQQVQQAMHAQHRALAARVDMAEKRVLDDQGAVTADAEAHKGEITVDDQPVYPQVPNLDVDANQEFGGSWRRVDTDQVVQVAGLHGAGGRRGAFGPVDGRNQFGEFQDAPIPADQALQPPQQGWDAVPNKPGLLASGKKRTAYQQASQARADVVARAFGAMRNDRAPGYVQQSAFGRQEWARLQAERKARHDALRRRLNGAQMQPGMLMGNLLFGVVDEPRPGKKDRKK